MSLINKTIYKNQFDHGTSFTQRLGASIREFSKALVRPINMQKLAGINLPNDQMFAVTFVKSKLATIPEIKDFGCIQHNDSLSLFAYIDQPNEDAENKVYAIYSKLLDLFPKTDVDVRIIELYGRTKEELPQIEF